VSKYTKEDGTIVTTLQGVDIKPGTASATIDKLAESFVGDESQILSILYQNGYQYTQDESLKGKDKYIYYDIKNGTYDYDKDKAVDFVKEDINNSIPVSIDTSKVETELDKRLKTAQVERAEGLADIVKEELEDLKLDQDSEDEAVNDITNFVKNEFPIPETFVKNQTNVKSLLTSGLQNLGYTFGKYNKDSITVNVPGGDSFQVSIAGINDAEGIVNKIVEAVFINKPITDIAKLAKVRGVLTATQQTEETPGEEVVEEGVTKTGILD